jgi:hypothetical protein
MDGSAKGSQGLSPTLNTVAAMLSSEQEERIASGLAQCLTECRSTDGPFSRVSAYIKSLQEDPEWTEAEIIELQTRVIRALLYQRGRPAGEPDPRKTT